MEWVLPCLFMMLLISAGVIVSYSQGHHFLGALLGGVLMGIGFGIVVVRVAGPLVTQSLSFFREKKTNWVFVSHIALSFLIWLVIGAIGVSLLTILLRRFQFLIVIIGPISPASSLAYTLCGIYIGLSLSIIPVALRSLR